MKIDELVWNKSDWIVKKPHMTDPLSAQLIFIFGDVDTIAETVPITLLQALYPNARIVGASTAGTIESGTLSQYPLVATVVAFEQGWVEVATMELLDNATLEERSQALIAQLPQKNLKHVFVLMEGLKLNGSLFVKGLNPVDRKFPITGALAGDGWKFDHTLIRSDREVKEFQSVAVGFYGDSLHIEVGHATGWEEFGAERVITKSEGHVVYEIDDKPALKLYEDYLGEFIKDLPTSGLRFPLSVRENGDDNELARVMMGINEDKSLVFGVDIPQGSIVRLMKTNVKNLIEGAESLAKGIGIHNEYPSLAIAISCSARRSVLKQLVGEELEALRESLSKNTHICGFYSYGEIAPFADNLLDCKLHNQTMTLTVIYEDTDA
jgi:hypothetical protein